MAAPRLTRLAPDLDAEIKRLLLRGLVGRREFRERQLDYMQAGFLRNFDDRQCMGARMFGNIGGNTIWAKPTSERVLGMRDDPMTGGAYWHNDPALATAKGSGLLLSGGALTEDQRYDVLSRRVDYLNQQAQWEQNQGAAWAQAAATQDSAVQGATAGTPSAGRPTLQPHYSGTTDQNVLDGVAHLMSGNLPPDLIAKRLDAFLREDGAALSSQGASAVVRSISARFNGNIPPAFQYPLELLQIIEQGRGDPTETNINLQQSLRARNNPQAAQAAGPGPGPQAQAQAQAAGPQAQAQAQAAGPQAQAQAAEPQGLQAQSPDNLSTPYSRPGSLGPWNQTQTPVSIISGLPSRSSSSLQQSGIIAQIPQAAQPAQNSSAPSAFDAIAQPGQNAAAAADEPPQDWRALEAQRILEGQQHAALQAQNEQQADISNAFNNLQPEQNAAAQESPASAWRAGIPAITGPHLPIPQDEGALTEADADDFIAHLRTFRDDAKPKPKSAVLQALDDVVARAEAPLPAAAPAAVSAPAPTPATAPFTPSRPIADDADESGDNHLFTTPLGQRLDVTSNFTQQPVETPANVSPIPNSAANSDDTRALQSQTTQADLSPQNLTADAPRDLPSSQATAAVQPHDTDGLNILSTLAALSSHHDGKEKSVEGSPGSPGSSPGSPGSLVPSSHVATTPEHDVHALMVDEFPSDHVASLDQRLAAEALLQHAIHPESPDHPKTLGLHLPESATAAAPAAASAAPDAESAAAAAPKIPKSATKATTEFVSRISPIKRTRSNAAAFGSTIPTGRSPAPTVKKRPNNRRSSNVGPISPYTKIDDGHKN